MRVAMCQVLHPHMRTNDIEFECKQKNYCIERNEVGIFCRKMKVMIIQINNKMRFMWRNLSSARFSDAARDLRFQKLIYHNLRCYCVCFTRTENWIAHKIVSCNGSMSKLSLAYAETSKPIEVDSHGFPFILIHKQHFIIIILFSYGDSPMNTGMHFGTAIQIAKYNIIFCLIKYTFNKKLISYLGSCIQRNILWIRFCFVIKEKEEFWWE